MFTLKQRQVTLAYVLASLLIVSCSTVPPCTGYSPAIAAKYVKAANAAKEKHHSAENKIAELIDTRADFHDAVLNPASYVSPYPLYLLGIEKPKDNFVTPYEKSVSCTDDKGDSPKFCTNNLKKLRESDREEVAEEIFDNFHYLTLTHILHTKSNSQDKECFIYNVYNGNKNSPSWCNTHQYIEMGKGKEDWTRTGWKALDELKKEIQEAVKNQQGEKATHIIVLATGWNTDQYESFVDFKAWMDVIAKDFKANNKAFRPIFVGISWESAWKLSEYLSWSTKGNDADEIGFTWANYLLNDVLKPIVASEPDIQLVAIGHSFGSRIVLGSHYVRDIIVRNQPDFKSVPVTLIGLQAAFSTGKFTLDEGKEHPYNANYKQPATVVITTSTKDKATGAIEFGTGYIGGEEGLEELRDNKKAYDDSITLPVFLTDTTGQPVENPDEYKVSVYDASPFVKCELQGTSSGAHSDVYDQQMGVFLGEIMRRSKK